MLILRATKTLMKEMKADIDKLQEDKQKELFSWHANIFILNRRKHVIFMNDSSRLSLTLSGIRSNQYKDLKNIFLNALKEYLLIEDLNELLINLYIGESQEIHISNTNNRSVLGTMTEAVKLMNYLYSGVSIPDLNDLNKENNRIIYKPIKYLQPIEVFRGELNKHFEGDFKEGTGKI